MKRCLDATCETKKVKCGKKKTCKRIIVTKFKKCGKLNVVKHKNRVCKIKKMLWI